MSFGEKGMEQKYWSDINFEIALTKMQEETPTFGLGGNTYEKDGKYFAMGLEVTEPLYEKFLDRFELISGEVIYRKNQELSNAA